MSYRRNLVISCVLSKIRKFERVHVKFPNDIELFAKNIIEKIDEFCEHSLEVQQYEALYMETSDESSDESLELATSMRELKIKKEQDEDYVPEKNTKNLPLECYYSFERMQEIYDMCNEPGATRQKIAKKLHKTKSQIDAICARVIKGPSTEYKKIQLKNMLKTKFLEESQKGTLIKGDTLITWANEIINELEKLNPSKEDGGDSLPKMCTRSFIDAFKRENRIVSRAINFYVSKKKFKTGKK